MIFFPISVQLDILPNRLEQTARACAAEASAADGTLKTKIKIYHSKRTSS